MIITDQIGRELSFKEKPVRIVSLVPSQTEYLFALGLDDAVIGITRFCIHPEKWFKSKKRIGGTKALHIEEIKALMPDLIIANKEENQKEQIEELCALFPVYTSDIHDLDTSYQMMLQLARIVGKEQEGETIIKAIKLRFAQWQALPNPLKGKSVLYCIWSKPLMAAGKGTFINYLLEKQLGLVNCVALKRYPIIKEKAIDVDVVFLSTEPYPFSGSDVTVFEKMYPNAIVKLVDGELFSWYGSRLLSTPAYFKALITEINVH